MSGSSEPKVKTARKFCFKLCNPSSNELESPRDWPYVKYAMWQYQSDERTGVPYLQGFVSFKQPLRPSALKKIDQRISWRNQLGSHAANVKHCTKEEGRIDGPWEHGNPPRQGQRTDLERSAREKPVPKHEKARSKHKKPIPKLKKSFFTKFGKVLTPAQIARVERMEDLSFRYAEHRDFKKDKVVVKVFYGAASHETKMRRALAECESEPYIVKRPKSRKNGAVWFDDYRSERDIIIPHYDAYMPFYFLKSLLQPFPMHVPRRWCSGFPFLGLNFWILSEKHPEQWYPRDVIDGVMSRLTYVYELPADEEEKQ